MRDFDKRRAFGGGGNSVNPSVDGVFGKLFQKSSPQRGGEYADGRRESSPDRFVFPRPLWERARVRGVNKNKRLITDWIVSHTLTMTKNFTNFAIFRFAQDDKNSCYSRHTERKRKYPVTNSKELSCKKDKYIEINNQLDCFGSKEPHNDYTNSVILSESERSHKRGDFTNNAILRCTQNDSKNCVVSKSKYKVAFSLAETLITLGIIGVIVAITLPTLIQHHRKTVIETSLKKFYTTINQAVELSVADNGETSSWKFGDTDTEVEAFYNTYFRKYLKDVKTKDAKTNYYVYFSDGSGVEVSYKGHDWVYCLKAEILKNL